MKIEKNNKYFTISVYTIATVLVTLVIAVLLFNLSVVGGYLAKVIGTLWVLIKPLVFGLVLAYLIDPIVVFYDKKCYGMYLPFRKRDKTQEPVKQPPTRAAATALAYVTVIAFLGLFILIISLNVTHVMGVLRQSRLSDTLAMYMHAFEVMIKNVSVATTQVPFLGGDIPFIVRLTQSVQSLVNGVTEKLLEGLTGLGGQLVNLGLGTVIAFYLLKDKKRLLVIAKRLMHLFIPKRIEGEVKDVVQDVDYVFSGYIRGQLLDAIIMGTLISIVLTLIGIDFAVVIGIISGIFNLIPYFGPVVGFVLAGFIGFIGPSPIKGVYAILAVMALQQLDGWVIVPRIMGQTVKLHPVVVLLAVITGGQLFGLIGFLLGVPVAGFIRLCIIRYMGDLFSTEE